MGSLLGSLFIIIIIIIVIIIIIIIIFGWVGCRLSFHEFPALQELTRLD